MNEDKESVAVSWNGKNYILIIEKPLAEILAEDYLRIDHGNLIGEILTFPVFFNRVGSMRAEAQSILAEVKLFLDLTVSNLSTKLKKDLTHADSSGKVHKPTVNDIDSHVKSNEEYLEAAFKYIEAERYYNHIDSLYWSAKSKDTKLDKLSSHLTPEEFQKDLLEVAVNGVMIKRSSKTYL